MAGERRLGSSKKEKPESGGVGPMQVRDQIGKEREKSRFLALKKEILGGGRDYNENT